MAGIGDNSVDPEAKKMLNDGVKEIIGLMDQIDEIRNDLKERKLALKGQGFDMKAIGVIVKQERMDRDKRDKLAELRDVVEVYGNALGIDVLMVI